AIVEIPADLKERLGKEIKLNKKDFEKLMKNKREKYIPQIKETFKEPEAVFIDENDDLIFTKTFNDKLFFVNVNRDYGEAFKALSLAPKKNNNLLNKLNKAKEILKLDSKLRDYTAQQAFTGVLSASNKSSGEIIPQQKIKFAMEKFHYDEKKAKDLLEWHKNSHALTKDENGLPKVFYHGTYSKFRVFRRVGKASQQGFFFTPSQKATEEYGDITLNTFLNIKNPFRADELKINKEADLQKWADILKLDYDKEKYESFKDLKTKLEKVKEATKKAGFKFHSASGGGVYVIDNKGRNSFINLEELDKENKRVVEAFKGLETEDIYFYYVVRNEFDLVLYALNKNDRYFHKSGRDEVKRVLEKLGYDGVVLNDTIITVFNSNQIKHIDNKGSFTDTKGNVTSKKPKDKEAEFSYFN
ncbi:hypothetical protein BLN40_08650, partial [Campylobacter upsaliensis]|nr:hypothetical protein [Campylobacter upsaliensis]